MAGRGYIKVDYGEERSSHEVGGGNKQHCLDLSCTVNFRPAEPSHIVRQYHKQNEEHKRYSLTNSPRQKPNEKSLLVEKGILVPKILVVSQV